MLSPKSQIEKKLLLCACRCYRPINSATVDEICRGLGVWRVVGLPILEVFRLSLGNELAWGQFSAAYYYSLRRSYLSNFVEIGQAVSPLSEVEDSADTSGQLEHVRMRLLGSAAPTTEYHA